jgi:mycothiol synthase
MYPVETIAPADLHAVLGIIPAHHVSGFCEYLAHGPAEWEGLRCGDRRSPVAVFFALRLPGGTAIVLIPSPGELGIDPEEQLRLTHAGLARLGAHDLYYAQALLEPSAAAAAALLERTGFRPLATLEYLERDALHPWVDPPAPAEAEWVQYQENTHEQFAQTVLATYRDSQDCPELTGLRPIDDILAGHSASGRFDPQLWELARVDGRVAGCLLLAALTHAPLLEVVYMGVVPEFRRRGVGQLLLRRALEQCHTAGARRLTVVVDERNAPAKRLYARLALSPVARRKAFFYRWKWEPGVGNVCTTGGTRWISGAKK